MFLYLLRKNVLFLRLGAFLARQETRPGRLRKGLREISLNVSWRKYGLFFVRKKYYLCKLLTNAYESATCKIALPLWHPRGGCLHLLRKGAGRGKRLFSYLASLGFLFFAQPKPSGEIGAMIVPALQKKYIFAPY